MPTTPSRAGHGRNRVIMPTLILGLLGLAWGGCVTTASRDVSLNAEALAGKSHAWFAEHWGTPRARAKRFFGGETWVYFHIDGGRIDGGHGVVPWFPRAPHECEILVTFDQEGIFEEAARANC